MRTKQIYKFLIKPPDLNELENIIQNNPKVLQLVHLKSGCTPATWAAYNNHADALEVIINLNPYILYQKDNNGNTPTILAASYGHTASLEVIIKTNPELLNQTDIPRNTPAILAARYGHTAALEAMIEVDPSVFNQKNQLDETPAILAATHGHTKTLELMLDKDPKMLQQKDNKGNTPSIMAAYNGHTGSLKVMIDKDPTVLQQKDKDGHNPAYFACLLGHEKTLKLIQLYAPKNTNETPRMTIINNLFQSIKNACLNAADNNNKNEENQKALNKQLTDYYQHAEDLNDQFDNLFPELFDRYDSLVSCARSKSEDENNLPKITLEEYANARFFKEPQEKQNQDENGQITGNMKGAN